MTDVDVRINGSPFPYQLLEGPTVQLDDAGGGRVTVDPSDPWWVENAALLDAENLIELRLDGTLVGAFVTEEDQADADDQTLVVLSGRGRARDLEHAVVLSPGFPDVQNRLWSFVDDPPLVIFSTALAAAQARGAATGISPSWSTNQDTDGENWTVTVDVELEPGVNLLTLLEKYAVAADAHWLCAPDGTLDARQDWGTDRSDDVVFFVGRDQVRRTTRRSRREIRNWAAVEGPTGVTAEEDAGSQASWGRREVWIQAGDASDPATRAAYGQALIRQVGGEAREIEVEVVADGAFVDYQVGDWISVDIDGDRETVRVLAITPIVDDHLRVELTLETVHQVREKRLERLLETMSDATMAADPTVQRRHGLVTADRILTGSLQVETEISGNYVPDSAGWIIEGDGTAEFNDVTVRGTIIAQSGTIGGWTIEADKLSGAGAIEGGSITGTTITGVTITGGTIRTSASAPRVEMSSVNQERISFFDGGGALAQIHHAPSGLILTAPSRVEIHSVWGLHIEGSSESEITGVDRIIVGQDLTAMDAFALNSGARDIALRAGESSEIEWQSRPRGSTGAWKWFASTNFRVVSERSLKDTIRESPSGALDHVVATPVRRYHVRGERDEVEHVGFVADEMPDDLRAGDGYSLPDTVALLWQAVQELAADRTS